jgi:hypothetical protein
LTQQLSSDQIKDWSINETGFDGLMRLTEVLL